MPKAAGWSVHGVDFTSRPRVQKAITVASGRSRGSVFHLDNVEDFADWAHFECWLRRPGPWIAGFDFPFGLPRETVDDLRWPKRWPQLVAYFRPHGRDGLRQVAATPFASADRQRLHAAGPRDRKSTPLK